jgi:integrase
MTRGIGSIEKRGDKYQLIISLGYDANGKKIRRKKTCPSGSTITQARRLLAEFLVEVNAADYIAPQKLTFAQFVEEWRKRWAAKNLHPNTLESYEHQLKNHILPVLTHKRLDTIKTIHLVKLMDELKRADKQEGELSSNSKYFVFRVLSSVFKKAKTWKVIKENPLDGVDRPKVSAKQKKVLELEEVSLLLDCLETAPQHYQMIIKLALFLSLRKGEILGLEWKHIDLEAGTLEVTQTWGKKRIGEVKTDKSHRILQLPDELWADLKAYKRHWNNETMSIGLRTPFLFPKLDGMPILEKSLENWMKRFLTEQHSLHLYAWFATFLCRPSHFSRSTCERYFRTIGTC